MPRAPSSPEEIFVLDLKRTDGSRFVTAVRMVSAITATRRANPGAEGQVSHWQRRGQVGQTDIPHTWSHPMDGWELHERFPL